VEKHVCLHGDKATEARRERDIFPIGPFLLKVCKSMCAFMVTKIQNPRGEKTKILLDLRMEKHVCLQGDKTTEACRDREINFLLDRSY
jgi:hypothetical protein